MATLQRAQQVNQMEGTGKPSDREGSHGGVPLDKMQTRVIVSLDGIAKGREKGGH